MEKPLSSRQQRVLDFIKDYYLERGFPPSVRDICAGVGLKSTSTVHGHLQRLEKKGLLKHDPACPRTILLASTPGPSSVVNVPIVGKVTAGLPILAVENLEGTLPLPADKVKGKEMFGLVVKGRSMIDEGILDGDSIVVQRDAEVHDGDIVVALVAGEEATVKKIYHEGETIRLQPANASMEPIYAHARDVSVLGKVMGVSRWF